MYRVGVRNNTSLEPSVTPMKRLQDLLGKEHNLDTVSRALRDYGRSVRAVAVGAHHVTCSDECERECTESFQQWFAQDLLPELKFASKSPFRTANLGGQYEWGGVPIAEHHFATPETNDAFKLLVIKLNAHVSIDKSGTSVRYGRMERYDSESTFCGALHALLDGAHLPALDKLREAFRSEGVDRLAMLRDPAIVDPQLRPLLAAVVSARLQARRVILEIQQYTPSTPTLHLVMPCVTINRKQRDTELVVGVYSADSRGGEPKIEYRGLGDDPSKYRVAIGHGWLHFEDDNLSVARPARDHREMVFARWRERESARPAATAPFDEIARLTDTGKHDDPNVAGEALKTLLWILADMAPVPTSILLFAKGIAGIHHVYRAHRLSLGQARQGDARRIIEDVHRRVDQLPPKKAREALELLVAHHRC